MPDLIIRKRLNSLTFGVWKWREEDHARPLTFQLDGARSQVYVEEHRIRDDPLEIVMYLQFVLIFQAAPREYIVALKSRGGRSTQFAYRIYDYFRETISRLEGVLRVSGKVRNLMSTGIPSIHRFYDARGFGWGEEVTWRIDDQQPQEFRSKLGDQPRGRNPLFKHPQLVTVGKWERLQEDVDANRLPSEDVVELHRLAGNVYPKSKRVPVVEAAILIESKLKAYAETILPTKGFSKSKLKDLKDELTFNTVLNLLLPLTLTKTEMRSLRQLLPLVDRIRKLRMTLFTMT